MNLIGNAVKFTEKGEIYADVQLRELKGETALLRFEVRDTGIGISSRHDKAFLNRSCKSMPQLIGGSVARVWV